ncbi:hypothetical protein EON77_22040, partial [bacterium]
ARHRRRSLRGRRAQTRSAVLVLGAAEPRHRRARRSLRAPPDPLGRDASAPPRRARHGQARPRRHLRARDATQRAARGTGGPPPLRLVGRVARAALEEGAMVRLKYPPFHVLVSRVGDAYAAIEDACNHAGASLAKGPRIEGDKVVCPMHGYVFALASGELLAPKGLCDHQRRFVVTEDGDSVLVWEPTSLVIKPL